MFTNKITVASPAGVWSCDIWRPILLAPASRLRAILPSTSSPQQPGVIAMFLPDYNCLYTSIRLNQRLPVCGTALQHAADRDRITVSLALQLPPVTAAATWSSAEQMTSYVCPLAACSYPAWYPRHAGWALRSVVLPLPDGFAEYLQVRCSAGHTVT